MITIPRPVLTVIKHYLWHQYMKNQQNLFAQAQIQFDRQRRRDDGFAAGVGFAAVAVPRRLAG
jgi:hypothetical protein